MDGGCRPAECRFQGEILNSIGEIGGIRMDKFTDWKRYVQEETDKARKEGRLKEETHPPRQVPSYDPDRYRIRRNKELEDNTPATPKKIDDREKEPEGKQPWTPESPGSAPSLTSPFVSVQQVWDAAERTNRSRKSIKKEDTALKQRKLPGISRTFHEQGETEYPQGPAGPAHEETREELLERLVNPTISLEEAAKIMGVCKATVRRYTEKGILQHYRTPGNQRRFKLNDIIHFLEEQKR